MINAYCQAIISSLLSPESHQEPTKESLLQRKQSIIKTFSILSYQTTLSYLAIYTNINNLSCQLFRNLTQVARITDNTALYMPAIM